MQRSFFIALFFPLLLFCEWEELFKEKSDSAIVHSVNVISGGLQLFFEDSVAKGVNPIAFTRTFCNKPSHLSTDPYWKFGSGWTFFPHMHLEFYPKTSAHNDYVNAQEPSGQAIQYHYKCHQSDGTLILQGNSPGNSTSGVISGRLNPSNHTLHINDKNGFAILHLANGGKRIYRKIPKSLFKKIISSSHHSYLLQEEISPSHQKTIYRYNAENRSVQIFQTNPERSKIYAQASIRKQSKSPFHIRVTTSGNRALNYKGYINDEDDRLTHVHTFARPPEYIHYDKYRHLEIILCPNKDLLSVKYDNTSYDRVSEIKNHDTKVASFSYAENVTDVRNYNNILTRYHHFGFGHLNYIEYFDHSERLSSTQRFFWGNKALIGKALCNENGAAIFSKTFSYDDYGNALIETLYGNLTGENEGPFSLGNKGILIGSDQYSKWYEYDPVTNLLIKETEQAGLIHLYTYLEGTDLILEERITDFDGKTLLRKSFSYDEDNLLIKESLDDNYFHFEKVYTRSPINGSITSLEADGIKTEYAYSIHNELVREDITDAGGERRYSIHYDYDDQGRLISQSTPCGGRNTYRYDDFCNLLSRKEVGSPEISFTYDRAFRPIQRTSNGQTIHTTYNTHGSVTSETDPFGNVTRHTYDAFERRTSTIFPEVLDENGNPYHPVTEYGYDIAGNLIFEKTPKGHIHRRSYNVFNKLTKEVFPDGSEIRHIYNLDGTLKKTIHQDGSCTEYTHDLFQRMTSKKSAFSEETWVYSALRLLSYTDSNGLVTTYTYDAQGRKIEERSLDRCTTYKYDLLGFVKETITEDITHTKINDVEGKVIEEDTNGENKTFYTYDNEGRKTSITKITSEGEAIDLVAYNQDGKMIRHTDPLGAVTQFFYDKLTKTTIDPEGITLIETYDALSRLIQKEKKDPKNKTLALEHNFYDRSGNLARKKTYVYKDNTILRTVEVLWEYDFRGLLTKETFGEKVTQNTYDLMRRLIKKTLPNGTVLTNTYDEEGRILESFSSDGTIHYVYSYDRSKNPIKIEDNVHNTRLERTYNLFGEVIYEKRGKITLSWDYDTLGRETAITLPDRSTIAYEYLGNHMRAVKRLSPKNKLLYEHTYDTFDVNGHVSKESLIFSLGQLTSDYDLLERAYKASSPFYTLSRSFNPSGLVVASNSSLFGTKNYEYDGLHQLIKDEDREYYFDSLGNPTDTKVNEHNQLLDHFLYDLNGNPQKRLKDSTEYEYDALNRLIALTTQEKRIEFVYDPASRLVSKTTLQKDGSTDTRFYIYDKEYEIGTVNNQGDLLDLKVMGLALEGDMGSAIAIEIQDAIYAPLHDFQGNIIALLNQDEMLVESYNYDAFGRETSKNPFNPWRFASKRHEEDLIYFGKRFYDTPNGRWLTPDPLGCFESINVYLYVLNSPLNRLDLFGLSSMPAVPNNFDDKFFSPLRNAPYTARIFHAYLRPPIYQAIATDVLIISNQWHKIRFNPIEKIFNKADLFNHLHSLIPKEQGIIGLITAQNGINNTFADFQENCNSIIKHIPENTTFIGIHNKTEGAALDIHRTFQESAGTLTQNARETGSFLAAISDVFMASEAKSLWAHFPHSEAGLLFNLGHTLLNDSQKDLLKNQLIVFAVAPAKPISWKHCLDALSIYSRGDKVTGWGAKKYQNNPDYNIQFIKSKAGPFAHFDHSFTGPTYAPAIKKRIEQMRDDYGFYDTRKR